MSDDRFEIRHDALGRLWTTRADGTPLDVPLVRAELLDAERTKLVETVALLDRARERLQQRICACACPGEYCVHQCRECNKDQGVVNDIDARRRANG